jgi:PKD repeat protein
MKKIILITLFLNICAFSQSKRVLFLGNSYTQVNNLPQLFVNVAQSTNDAFIIDSNTPGGHTLQQHNSNASSLSKINQGNWDFVVLQEQSQLPSFPINQVNSQVFPFAQSINNLIVSQNPCAETVFYMTWGRQNGDSQNCAANPAVCTYEGMDDLLRERYMTMTTNNEAIVSPVGAVWRYLRTNHPTLNLYSSDGSHPSIIGSYAAACSFYTAITRKNPTLITFNSTLSSVEADTIKQAVKNVVFDQLLNWKIGNYDLVSNFTFSSNSSSVINFLNNSRFATSYTWDFGDGNSSNEVNPTHNYASEGEFIVKLTASKCGNFITSQQTITISNLSNIPIINENIEYTLYPNPTKENVTITSNTIIDAISIYDINGRLIDYIEVKSAQKTLDFSTKKEGFYFLKINSNGRTCTKKLIKN